MGRPAKLEPRWLVGLLNQWALRDDRNRSRGIGYYSVNPMLKDGIPGRARSFEPTGFCEQDFTDAEKAIEALEQNHRLAVVRYFKPWAKHAIDGEVSRSDDTWLRWLKEALAIIEADMDRKKVRQVLDTYQDVRLFCANLAD